MKVTSIGMLINERISTQSYNCSLFFLYTLLCTQLSINPGPRLALSFVYDHRFASIILSRASHEPGTIANQATNGD